MGRSENFGSGVTDVSTDIGEKRWSMVASASPVSKIPNA